jgi:peptidoglycan hydrolase-like protein with peptidoglycan-binding domain
MNSFGTSFRRRPLAWVLAVSVALAAFGSAPAARADCYDGLTAYQNRDFVAAMHEFAPLAEQGDARAQTIVGLMYRDGQAVPQDYVRAHQWLNLAAAAGQQDAAKARDELAARMEPGQIAEAQRLASAWRPVSAAAAQSAVAASETMPSAGGDQADATRPLTSAEISELQWQLAVHGYDPGTADGVVGWRTRQAIADYQQDAKLPVDGEPSAALLSHLRYANPPVRSARLLASLGAGPSSGVTSQPGPMASPSATGPAGGDLTAVPVSSELLATYTTAVQEALQAKGYRPGAADGLLGPRTRAAIRRYQQDYGLPVTGEVSLALLNHLRLVSGYPVGYSAPQT